ncbi:30S ribosomal protein S24e [Acidianus sulfidivorans JP7]|uniref:Small ribosomal subunit protein eS24 n=1 Tax=Acidianus sulfidivorans JP7 TaxID=619593 RepID=A0A2U9IM92_9CREN|nr:30S ribosomal protein S24e [Acidianus sulfidivorans]AWR97148.1 30S ribosomal protein S24e [Acidianus sulfidivorans JP7]
MSQAQQIKISDKVQGIIEKDVNNKVVGRRELSIKLFHIGAGTPSREDIRNAISSLLNSPKDLIVVRKISTSYGSGTSIARVHIYDKKEIMEKFEPEYLLKRGTSAKKEGEESGKEKSS